MQKYGFCFLNVMVFGVQKGGFYNAKSGFLKEHIGILGV